MSGELKGCPFCGRRPQLEDRTAYPAAGWALLHEADQCLLWVCKVFDTEAEARAAWNRRAPDQSAELVSELVERLSLARTALIAQGTSPTARGIADIDATLAKAKAGGA